jgi:hypothetical protein
MHHNGALKMQLVSMSAYRIIGCVLGRAVQRVGGCAGNVRVVNHAFLLAIHELSHNLAIRRPVLNRLFGCS